MPRTVIVFMAAIAMIALGLVLSAGETPRVSLVQGFGAAPAPMLPNPGVFRP